MNTKITALMVVLLAGAVVGLPLLLRAANGAPTKGPLNPGDTKGESEMVMKTEGARKTQVAYLAGGCFLGMEELIRALPGVVGTEVGYTGGKIPNPVYERVSTGATGHAESLKVEFDPEKLPYRELLQFFFKIHDPTTLNQQGNDRGTQYRSAIFYADEEQHSIATDVIAAVNASGKWKRPVVTEVTAAGPWTAAEEYHQDYLQKNPGGYTCHYIRD
jgi:methionine-S-sulfoxide reductase